MGKPESDLTKVALKWLEFRGVFAWRNNTGAWKGKHKGKRFFIRYGLKGSSDIFGVLPNGRFLAAEAKADPSEDASDDQAMFIERVNAQGGLGFVFHNLDELIEQVEEEL